MIFTTAKITQECGKSWRLDANMPAELIATPVQLARCRGMTQPTLRAQKTNEHRQDAARRVSTQQIAKDAVRGGAKSEKKNKRPGAGGAQKG